jgi:hypothetical protein
MNVETFMNEMKNRKGQTAWAEWSRPMKTLKKSDVEILKTVRALIRTGIEFQNLKQNEDRETGELQEWQEWEEYPYILRKKIKVAGEWISDPDGQRYYRLYRPEDGLVEVTYTMNGLPATRDEINAYLLASEKGSGGDGPILTFQVKVEELTSISNAVA